MIIFGETFNNEPLSINMYLINRNLRTLLLIAFFLGNFLFSDLIAQNNDEIDKRAGQFFVGGNLGLQFGTVTLIDVSPMVGYFLTQNWNVGIGGTYKYYRYKLLQSEYTSTYYGGRAFSQVYLASKKVQILNHIFIHGEYEYLNIRFNTDNAGAFEKTNLESYFGGLGYRAPISQKVSFSILLLYNFNDSAESPYENPVIRVGVTVGL